METTARYPDDTSVLYGSSASHLHRKMRASCFSPTRPYSVACEAPERQMTDTDHHETRKRSRDGAHNSTPTHSAPSLWGNRPLASSRFTDVKSPPPLAHDRYELAQGSIEESSPVSRQNGDYDDYDQLQKQRGNWSVPPTPYGGAVKQPAVDDMVTTPNGSKSWTIMGLVGGVAGKLFQFCTVPFRGFQAGPGTKYNLSSQQDIATRLGLEDDPAVFHFTGAVQQVSPADFPPDNYGVHSIESVRDEHPRTCKRQRTADNWVVVGNNGDTDSEPSTPRLSERRIPEYHVSPSQIPRPVSRTSVTPSSLKRPSLIPVSRRTTMDRRSFLSSPRTSQRPYTRQSYASPTKYEDKTTSKLKNPLPKSPLPKESQRLINKVRREELEEDARMRRMSSQMSAMLREAKEALGSKFEVGNYGDDGDAGEMEMEMDADHQGGGYPNGAPWFS